MPRHTEIDLTGIRPVPIGKRKNKVKVEDFARAGGGRGFRDFWAGLPNILAGRDIRALVGAIRAANERGKPIVWFLGAHVIKVGLSPLVTDMIRRGFATAVGMNGSGMIHDVEVAMIGATSEDVTAGMKAGNFGMARETAEFLNGAVLSKVREGMGLGEAAGAAVQEAKLPHRGLSITRAALLKGIPCTVHVAIGTDIVHEHPSFDPAAAGTGTYRDFRIMADVIARCGNGGVIIVAGSSVILPLIIEKSISIARNLGRPLVKFTGANLDFIRHYRAQLNPVRRAEELGGTGISIVGHHELTLPLIHRALRTGAE
ncbi:MAG: hypothetical protein AB1742_01290 [bacterium]